MTDRDQTICILRDLVTSLERGEELQSNVVDSFIHSITELEDPSLLDLAPSNVRLEIDEMIKRLRLNGVYRVYIAHSGAGLVDISARMRKLDELINGKG